MTNAYSSTSRTSTPTGGIFTRCRGRSNAGIDSEPRNDESFGAGNDRAERQVGADMRIERLLDRPIISADLHPSIGSKYPRPIDDPSTRLDRRPARQLLP